MCLQHIGWLVTDEGLCCEEPQGGCWRFLRETDVKILCRLLPTSSYDHLPPSDLMQLQRVVQSFSTLISIYFYSITLVRDVAAVRFRRIEE